MTILIPDGYGTSRITREQSEVRHGSRMIEPFRRRLFPWLESEGGLIGIGGGWRTNPHPVSPASMRGESFHQTQLFANGTSGYGAVDLVALVPGRIHRSPTWDEVKSAKAFGLHAFIGESTASTSDDEAWHLQCVEMRGYKTWVGAGRPMPALDFALPGGVNPPPTPTPNYGLYPLNRNKADLVIGVSGDLVQYVQQVMIDQAGQLITADGQFGAKTEDAVMRVQAFVALPVTGRVDWRETVNGVSTWEIIDLLAGHDWNAVPPPPVVPSLPVGGVETVTEGFYYVREGDSPWATAERVYGNGRKYTLLVPTSPPSPGYNMPNHLIRLPQMPGRTTLVLAGDGALKVIGRMFPGEAAKDRLARFYDLNGGEKRVLRPGDRVFVD